MHFIQKQRCVRKIGFSVDKELEAEAVQFFSNFSRNSTTASRGTGKKGKRGENVNNGKNRIFGKIAFEGYFDLKSVESAYKPISDSLL